MAHEDDTVEFPAITDDDDEDGPACGTLEAGTRMLVCFTSDGRLQFAERRACCYRHIPRPVDVLPSDAELHEVVIEDARTRTAVRDDGPLQITVLS